MELQALPVENVAFDESVEVTGDISKMDANQYLAWVRSQASRLPNIFRAEARIAAQERISHVSVVEDIPPCPAPLQPDPSWEREVVAAFSDLRAHLEEVSSRGVERLIAVPVMKDCLGWLRFCLGEDETISQYKAEVVRHILKEECEEEEDGEEGNDCEEEEEEEDATPTPTPSSTTSWTGQTGHSPSLQLILQLDQVLAQRVLLYLIDYLPTSSAKLSDLCGQWLYALLSRLEKPLHRDVVAALRTLYRWLCTRRLALHTATETAALADGEEVARLNLLAVLVGYYFGQGEQYRDWDQVVDEVEVARNPNLADQVDGSSEEEDSVSMEEEEEETLDLPRHKIRRSVEELEEGEEVEEGDE
eukprot:scaffold3817_cov177-Ochromonas_danica.AAC.5